MRYASPPSQSATTPRYPARPPTARVRCRPRSSAARFTGSQLTVIEDVTWGGPSSDGSRVGDITMTVLGQPVTLRGQLHSSPGGRGTIVALDGELKVAIPLLGRKMEESAAPAVLAGFRTQQRVGDQWLSR